MGDRRVRAVTAPARRAGVWALQALVVFTATLLPYVGIPGLLPGALSHPFIRWDDDLYILNNPFIRGLTWAHFKVWWTVPYFGNYAPIHLLSYAVNYAMRGRLVPADFHLVDALLHAGAAVLALFLFRRLAGGGARAVIAALLFALHPVQVETVVWASQRKSTLAMFFFLASVLLFLRHRDRTPRGIRSGWPTAAYLLSLGCFALSLLSKGMGVVLPVLLAIHEWLVNPRPERAGRAAEIVPYFLLAGAAGIATIWAQGAAGAIHTEERFGDVFLTMVVMAQEYLRTIFFPLNLNSLYYPETIQSPLRPVFLASAAVVLGSLLLVGLALRRAPRAGFWGLWFFISLVPVSGILPLTILRADRYLHLPSLALGGLAAEGLALAARGGGAARRRWAEIALVAVMACLGVLTSARVQVWASAEGLWRDSVAKAPQSHIAHGNLGLAYLEKGDLDAALAQYREAVRLQPQYAKGYYHIGLITLRRGRLGDAAASFHKFLEIAPEPPAWNPGQREVYADIHFYTALEALQAGRFQEAEAGYRRALSYRSRFWQGIFYLGVSLERQGKEADAYAAFRQASEIQPSYYEAHREAALAALRGGASVADAEREVGAALALRPEGPEAEALRRALAAAEKRVNTGER